MSSFVSFTSTNGDDPERELIRLLRAPLPTAERIKQAAQQQIDRIRKRTEEGRDVNGQTFTDYKSHYAQQRAKQSLRASPPNLRVSGTMLAAMAPEVRSETEFAIVFTDSQAETIAQAQSEGTSRIPARRFFDTSEEELDLLLNELLGGTNG